MTNPTSMPLDNAHVVMYYRFLTWLAAKNSKWFAQIHYYTLAETEKDPNWKPDHLRDK